MVVFKTFLSLLSLAVAAQAQSKNITALFGPKLSPGADIFLPQDPDYSTGIQQRWSIYKAPQYLGAIKPATEADIQDIVKIANANNIPFLATGAGHGCSTTYAALRDGIDIDMGNFRSVDVRAATNEMTIGGSTPFSDSYDPLFSKGKWVPTGSSPCVGFVGATVGAGTGPLQGLHGLDIDALLSVRLITAKGDLITVSKTQNTDLFWGIRGGGPNFGIISYATFRIFDAKNGGQITNMDFQLKPSANRSVWELIAAFDTKTLPAELTLQSIVFYNATAGETQLFFNSLYFGPQANAQPYYDEFVRAVRPWIIQEKISTVPWNKIFYSINFQPGVRNCQYNQYHSLYTVGLKNNNVDSYQKMFADTAAFNKATPGYFGLLFIARFPQQAVTAVPDSETAYPWRQSKTNVFFSNQYSGPSLDAKVDTFCKGVVDNLQKTSGYPYLSTYENYAHGTEAPKSWYSEAKLPRLTALKRTWDPALKFKFHNPLPLNYP